MGTSNADHTHVPHTLPTGRCMKYNSLIFASVENEQGKIFLLSGTGRQAEPLDFEFWPLLLWQVNKYFISCCAEHDLVKTNGKLSK